MSNPQNPDDPASLSLKPGRAGSGSKPDFGNVRSGARSTEPEVAADPRPDFSNVQSSARSTEQGVGATEYTVRKGDTLSHIAQAHYGRASQWRLIFDANRDLLDDPDRIQPGQVLKIPPGEAREDDRTTTSPHGDKR
jgi:nucleoid-associated protein YgaU